ncbi:MAG: hypothetical protein H6Q69_4324 [Firmicutes bacterium]|nr:hypothetical protein [Bacillota bacterium]
MSWLPRLDTSFTNLQDNEIDKIKTQTTTTELLESILNKSNSLDDNAVTINLSERAIQENKKLTLPTSYQTDDMSLLKTANDSLNEIQSLLQYGKALVIQASVILQSIKIQIFL